MIGLILILIVILILKSSTFRDRQGSNVNVPLQSLLPSPTPAEELLDSEMYSDEQIEQKQQEKPWISKIDIVGPEYAVRYSYIKSAIEINIYESLHGQTSEKRIEEIRNEVSSKLAEIGVDLSKEKIEVVYR